MEMEVIDIIGIVAGTCTTIAATPQLIKIYKTKDVADLSTGMFSVLVLGLLLWTIYGIMKPDWPIIVTNFIACVLNAIILFNILKFR